MHESALRLRRIELGLTRKELAIKSSLGHSAGDMGHILCTIERIEDGLIVCPKPRKTYEWASLAKALDCKVEDIYPVKG